MSRKPNQPQPDNSATQLLFVGTYNRPSVSDGVSGPGIHCLSFDTATGELSPLGTTEGIENPSYLCTSTDRSMIYAVWEVGEWPEGFITAYSINRKTGHLTPLRSQGSRGIAPCYISTDHRGSIALVANYVSGTVALLRIAEDGSLEQASSIVQHEGTGPDADRQKGPHAHCIVVDPTDRFAFACDLGTDTIYGYQIDREAGCLTAIDAIELAPGTGPRHLVFSLDAELAFVVGELDLTITTLRFDPTTGRLSPLQTLSTLPEGYIRQREQPVDAADIHVHPSGRFVYVSNRGHDSIAAFLIRSDENSPANRLELIGHQPTNGSWPRNFVLSDDGAFALVANQISNSITVFSIDIATGLFESAVSHIELNSPVCLQFGNLR